ncbi:hypothetical protein QJQ45_013048 [Haematococcus lacustris]|nr:hypothetical protein QJQ45_013048 [Haematococcus lacustris]
MLKTQVSRRRLSTCRRLFITEQCVVANTHRPGERTTVSRQLRVVYKYLRQRTLGLPPPPAAPPWQQQAAGAGAAPDLPPPPAAPPWQQQAAGAGAAPGLPTPPAEQQGSGVRAELDTSSTRKRRAGGRDRTQQVEQVEASASQPVAPVAQFPAQALTMPAQPFTNTQFAPQHPAVLSQVAVEKAREVARNMAATLQKQTQAEIERQTRTVIATKGRFLAPGQYHDGRDKALYLHIRPTGAHGQGDAYKAACVQAAVAHVQAMINGQQQPPAPSAAPTQPQNHYPQPHHQDPGAHPPMPSHAYPMSGTMQPYPPAMQGQPMPAQQGYPPPYPNQTMPTQWTPPPSGPLPGPGYAMPVPAAPTPSTAPAMGPGPSPGIPPAATGQAEPSHPAIMLYVNISAAHADFNLPERIRGPGGGFLGHVQAMSGCQVLLRGRGSVTMEGPDPLHVFISGPTPAQQAHAQELTQDLLTTIKKELLRLHPDLAPYVTTSTVVPAPHSASTHPTPSTVPTQPGGPGGPAQTPAMPTPLPNAAAPAAARNGLGEVVQGSATKPALPVEAGAAPGQPAGVGQGEQAGKAHPLTQQTPLQQQQHLQHQQGNFQQQQQQQHLYPQQSLLLPGLPAMLQHTPHHSLPHPYQQQQQQQQQPGGYPDQVQGSGAAQGQLKPPVQLGQQTLFPQVKGQQPFTQPYHHQQQQQQQGLSPPSSQHWQHATQQHGQHQQQQQQQHGALSQQLPYGQAQAQPHRSPQPQGQQPGNRGFSSHPPAAPQAYPGQAPSQHHPNTAHPAAASHPTAPPQQPPAPPPKAPPSPPRRRFREFVEKPAVASQNPYAATYIGAGSTSQPASTPSSQPSSNSNASVDPSTTKPHPQPSPAQGHAQPAPAPPGQENGVDGAGLGSRTSQSSGPQLGKAGLMLPPPPRPPKAVAKPQGTEQVVSLPGLADYEDD